MPLVKVWGIAAALLICLNILSVKSQDNSINSYDPETGCWYTYNNQTFSNDVFAGWQFIQTPVTSQITDIFFTDSLNGWATHASMGALKTTNSGFNWTAISFNDTNFTTLFNSIYFIDINTGWTVGGALQIRKTTNGGLNWVRQIPPPVAGIARSVFFIDANTGYVAGSKSFPYIPFTAKTTNGGNNWVEISPGFSGAQELNEQYWFNAGTGWIAGYDVLLYTTNGGANFSNLYANVPPSGNGHISLLSIQFVNQQTGWMGAANLERNNVYKTTNSGLNWFFQNNPISQGGMNQINDVLFLNTDSGWAVHGTPVSGAIMITTNGGNNWTIEEQSVNWFDCLENFQNKKMWCGSSGGRVWYATYLVGVSHNNNELAVEYKLFQNYPNPFNPVTKIGFGIPEPGFVNLIIYDMLGRTIKTLIDKQMQPGIYEITFDGSNLPSGTYFYKLTAGEFTDAKKMLIVK